MSTQTKSQTAVKMAAAMQLYAGFALLVIAILAIIVLAALVSNLVSRSAAAFRTDALARMTISRRPPRRIAAQPFRAAFRIMSPRFAIPS